MVQFIHERSFTVCNAIEILFILLIDCYPGRMLKPIMSESERDGVNEEV